jgi:hypothetical protein
LGADVGLRVSRADRPYGGNSTDPTDLDAISGIKGGFLCPFWVIAVQRTLSADEVKLAIQLIEYMYFIIKY